MTRSLALRLLRHYPLAWRERYEAEVCALIDDTGVRLRDLAELTRGMVIERVREQLSSDERPKRTFRFLALVPLAFSVTFVGLAVLTGFGVRALTGPWPESAQETAAWSVAVFIVIFFVVAGKTRRKVMDTSGPPYPAWVGAVLLPGLFLMFATIVAARMNLSEPTTGSATWFTRNFYWLQWCFYTSSVSDLCSCIWPTRRLLWAFLAVQGAEENLKMNQAWAASCKEWIAKGVPSPLADAERQIQEWTTRLADARGQVHAMGYRARFSRPDSDGAAA
jgi:hypothetical protein